MNEDSVIVIDRQEERKKRGALAVILAIAFIALLGIGSTFAYLTWTANQTPNRSTMGELTADLIEPTYTNAAITDNGGTITADSGVTSGITTSTAQYYSSDGKLIPKYAANMIPSTEYAKNPFVVNTSKAADAYGFAGLKVQFQYWKHKATTGDKGNEEASWVNMDDEDVTKLLKVYSISSNPNATTAGFKIDHAAKKWTGNKVNTTVTDVSTGDAGTTANKWIQLTGKDDETTATVDYGTTTAGTANETGAMYFVNFGRLASIANTQASDQAATTVSNPNFTTATSEARQAVKKNDDNSLTLQEKANVPTWGYEANDLNDTVKFTVDTTDATTGKFEYDGTYDASTATVSSSTSPLFQYVRYIDTAAQTDIDALMNVLDPVVTYADGYDSNSFTPGWRMVISAAIIQSTSPADVTGAAKDRTSYTDASTALVTVAESGTVSLNKGSTWFKQFKTVLDNVGRGTADSDNSANNVNRKNGQKPQAATGLREDSTFGQWWTKTKGDSGYEVTQYTGDGVPESTNIGASSDGAIADGNQVGSVDAVEYTTGG